MVIRVVYGRIVIVSLKSHTVLLRMRGAFARSWLSMNTGMSTHVAQYAETPTAVLDWADEGWCVS
jgi:hypothetical protein